MHRKLSGLMVLVAGLLPVYPAQASIYSTMEETEEEYRDIYSTRGNRDIYTTADDRQGLYTTKDSDTIYSTRGHREGIYTTEESVTVGSGYFPGK